jgi:hypothetical protein
MDLAANGWPDGPRLTHVALTGICRLIDSRYLYELGRGEAERAGQSEHGRPRVRYKKCWAPAAP